jgi:chemotaxis protein MotB
MRRENYSAWELSADRANAARRSLVLYAVAPEQIERVTGYADTRPLKGESPESEANQRITLSLTLTTKTTDERRKAAAGLRAGTPFPSAAAPSPKAVAPPSPTASP